MPRFFNELLIAAALAACVAGCAPAARQSAAEVGVEQSSAPADEAVTASPATPAAEASAPVPGPAADGDDTAIGAAPDEAVAAAASADAAQVASGESLPKTPVAPAVKREDVIWIQERLRQMGYYEGAVDGSVGSATRAAVRAYQQDQNIPVDGRPSSELRDYIYRNGG